MKIRAATLADADELGRLALRSKGHWGYSAEFLEACRAELLVKWDAVEAGRMTYHLAERDRKVLGFHGLERLGEGRFEMEALFVEPEFIGTGVGRELMKHALGMVADEGGKILMILSDPNAQSFYEAAGARLVGERPSDSIPGRFLPLLRINL